MDRVLWGHGTKRHLVVVGGDECGMNWQQMELERGYEAHPQSTGRILSLGLVKSYSCFSKTTLNSV